MFNLLINIFSITFLSLGNQQNKPWFVEFAYDCGVNILTIAAFRLPYVVLLNVELGRDAQYVVFPSYWYNI